MNRIIRRRKRLSEKSLYHFITRCRDEVKKCQDAEAYLAVIVLAGASVEYLLTAWCRAFPSAVYGKRKKLTDHRNLKDLNQLAYEHGFLNHKAYLAAERIRKFRNFVHPNWYAARRPLRFTKYLCRQIQLDYNSIIDSMQRNI